MPQPTTVPTPAAALVRPVASVPAEQRTLVMIQPGSYERLGFLA